MPILGTRAGASAQGYGLFGGKGQVQAFSSIATITAAGGETSLSLTSIPQTYTDLHIRALAKNSQTSTNSSYSSHITFNAVTTSIYAYGFFIGSGVPNTGVNQSQTAAGSFAFGFITESEMDNLSSASYYAVSMMDIYDYTSTTKAKAISAISGGDRNTGGAAYSNGMSWTLSTATTAITSIQFAPGTGTFVAGTTFALYGIKAAL